METIHQTDVLREKTSKGLDKFWQGQVLTDGTDFFTRSRTYQALAGGGLSKEVLSTPVRIEAKNVGRSNETSLREQAISEIKSDEAKKRKKGYVGEGEQKAILPLPMLAHSFEKRKHTISYPVCCMPKLDGIRLLSDSSSAWSRGGDPLIPEVVAHLRFEAGCILDGELILPPEAGGFQQTMKAAKKFRPELSPRLEYHVFDMVDEVEPFPERYERLKEVLKSAPPNVKLVPVVICHNEAEVLALLDQYLTEGFEGVMIRSREGGYVLSNRSVGLLKHKKFIEDREFVIVDVIEGKGSEEGCAIYVCRTPENREFNVRPMGDVASRRAAFADRANLIGRELTVKYQELSTDLIPRFPVGIGIRERSLQG
jgi:ATP-dependent DNA ligase